MTAVVLLFLSLVICHAQELLLDDMDDVDGTGWTALVRETANVAAGSTGAGCWLDTVEDTSAGRDLGSGETDWSQYGVLQFWMYSKVANNAAFQVVVNSDNPSDDEGWDYFSYELTLDWTGWRFLRLSLSKDFGEARNPTGWHQVTSLRFASSGWGHTPAATTMVCFDNFELVKEHLRFNIKHVEYALVPSSSAKVLSFSVTKEDGGSVVYSNTIDTSFLPSGVNLVCGGSMCSSGTMTADQASMDITLSSSNGVVGESGNSTIMFWVNSAVAAVLTLHIEIVALVITSPINHPFFALTVGEIPELMNKVNTYSWAASALDRIQSNADKWINPVVVPPEQGGWGLNYVCNDGTYLTYDEDSPHSHYCSSDDTYYTGIWYDRSWVSKRHSSIYGGLRDMALLSFIQSNATFAHAAIDLMMQYATFYPTMENHGVDWSVTKCGGRLLSQTLDESIWLVLMSASYDLLYPAMSPEERAHVEHNLLRSAAQCVLGCHRRLSNWQTWHNAGIASVAYVLQEEEWIDFVVHDPENGFYRQNAESILVDGFWYERSIGYHFFALEAAMWTAEFAHRAGGEDLYCLSHQGCRAGIESMILAPGLLITPNNLLPALNDGGESSVAGMGSKLEMGWMRYQNPTFKALLERALGDGYTRNHWYFALLRGVGDVGVDTENEDRPIMASAYLSGLGEIVLRTDTDLYVGVDFGEQGGGHGHMDKGSMMIHTGDGLELCRDPGTVAYSLDSHTEHFKRSWSHSTLVMNEVTQEKTEDAVCDVWLGHPLKMAPQVASGDMGSPFSNGGRGRRTVVVWGNALIDIVHGQSATPQTMEVLQHVWGDIDVESLSPGTAPTADPGWSYFSSVRSGNRDQLDYHVLSGDVFEDAFEGKISSRWTNLKTSTTHTRSGQAGLWEDHDERTSIRWELCPPDWSGFGGIEFWLYSNANNGAEFQVVVASSNLEIEGMDYYSLEMVVDWSGWKQVFYAFPDDFKTSRHPIGIHAITGFSISASGWNHVPDPTSRLWFDDFRVVDAQGTTLPSKLHGAHFHSKTFGDGSAAVLHVDAPNIPTTSVHPMVSMRRKAATDTYFVQTIDAYDKGEKPNPEVPDITVEQGVVEITHKNIYVRVGHKEESVASVTVCRNLTEGLVGMAFVHSSESCVVERDDGVLSVRGDHGNVEMKSWNGWKGVLRVHTSEETPKLYLSCAPLDRLPYRVTGYLEAEYGQSLMLNDEVAEGDEKELDVDEEGAVVLQQGTWVLTVEFVPVQAVSPLVMGLILGISLLFGSMVSMMLWRKTKRQAIRLK